MSIKLTWRRTPRYYTLTRWEGIHGKRRLPGEYMYGVGAKFWHDGTHNCIQLGGDNGRDLIQYTQFPDQLFEGTALSSEKRDSLLEYMEAAAKRLAETIEDVESAEVVVDTI